MSPQQLALIIPIVALCIPIVALFIPITAIICKCVKSMAEIKAKQGTTLAPEVREELSRLRQEVTALRDTTTRFDMSFDAAISRLEQRMDRAENALFEDAPPLTARIPARLEREERTVQLRR